MGTGWRRAFCTTIPRNSSDSPVIGDPTPSPRATGKLGFFKSSGSNPSTPRLQSNWSLRSRSSNNGVAGAAACDDSTSDSNVSTPRMRLRTKTSKDGDGGDDGAKFQSSVIDNLNITPRLRCKTNLKYPKSSLLGSNPSSPRSPFSILKTTLGLSKSNCGVCMQNVKSGNRTAIFTAECSHTFHFPCISKHVKKENILVCPICKSVWRDVSFLAVNKLQSSNEIEKGDDNCNNKPENNYVTTPRSRSEQNCIKLKPYDDDEPLLTPRGAGGGIIPIPELPENEDIDVEEEFKGFFVNPVTSSTADEFRRDIKSVEVMLMPEVALVSSSQAHETYAVVLKVKAPPPSPPRAAARMNQSTRAPIDLVAVLDVSASMVGAKLQMLKRAMRLVISSLGSADRLSIVSFSAQPNRLLPLRRMTSKGQRSARRIIDHLTCSHGTCAGEALRKATKVLEDRRERNTVASIILLSDGHEEHVSDNNTSNQRHPSGHVSSTRFAHVEIPVHTLDKTGGYRNESNDPAENAFTKCVGGLLSVVAQDLQIQLGVPSGSDPAEIMAVYSCNGKPMVLNSGSIRFGDLYAEEEREVLVELKVPRSNGSHHVLSARCSYNDPATLEVIYGGEKALLVPRAQTVRSSCSPTIQRLRNLFIATRAVAESRLLVNHNKLTTAHHLLSSARALLLQSASAEEFVNSLETELVDVEWRVQVQQQAVQQPMVDENGEPLTPTSAWRAAEKLAKVAVMKKSLNRVSDLHGFENARF